MISSHSNVAENSSSLKSYTLLIGKWLHFEGTTVLQNTAIYCLTQCKFPEDLHLQIKFVFNAWVIMRCSFVMHEQMQSSSDRWHLSMLAVTQTTTPVTKCTFGNFMVFESAMLNNSSQFYPSNKNAFTSLRPPSMD